MDLHELLLTRHSIRRYTSEPVDGEAVKTILEAGLLAPTSKNARSWQFVVVEDPAKLRELSECKPQYAAALKSAPLAIVVTSSPEKSEAFIEDASVAASFMMLQTWELGLGSCWTQVRGRFANDDETSEDVVRAALQIPHDMAVLCILSVGHPDEVRKPVDPAKLQWEKVHIGSWRYDDVDA